MTAIVTDNFCYLPHATKASRRESKVRRSRHDALRTYKHERNSICSSRCRQNYKPDSLHFDPGVWIARPIKTGECHYSATGQHERPSRVEHGWKRPLDRSWLSDTQDNE